MDDKLYQQARDIKAKITALNNKRNNVLSDFDAVSLNAADITDPEFINRLTSMRSILDQYFDSQVAPLLNQFEAL